MLDKSTIAYKNKIIMPLYLEITSIIKHFFNHDLAKLKKEYDVTKSLSQDPQIDTVYESLINNLT